MPETPQQTRSRQAFELQLCIAHVIDLGSILPTQGLCDFHHDEFLQALTDRIGLHPTLYALAQRWGEADEDVDDFSEQLNDLGEITGLAVRFQTPLRRGTRHPSWNCCTWIWVYAQTLEEAWALGAEWVGQLVEKATAKGVAHG